MERVALIADIHSNIVALKEVLKDIKSRGIKTIFCLGDLVLKGSSPCEVVDLIKANCDVVIKGNCDDYAVNLSNEHTMWHNKKLGKERIEYLDNLPMYKDFLISGSLVRFFHATKSDLNLRILDNFSTTEKMKLFEDENVDIVFYADIHKQYLQKIGNRTIVNIGSVGNPLEISGEVNENDNIKELTQAHYCVVEGEFNSKQQKSLSIQFVRVPYDINEELQLARKNKSPNYKEYEQELLKGKYRGKQQ